MTQWDNTTQCRAKGLWIGMPGRPTTRRRLSAAISGTAEFRLLAAYKSSACVCRRRRSRPKSDLKPYWGKPAVRNFREGEGNAMHGLMPICHVAPKGGHPGRHWPEHRRASSLLDQFNTHSTPDESITYDFPYPNMLFYFNTAAPQSKSISLSHDSTGQITKTKANDA